MEEQMTSEKRESTLERLRREILLQSVWEERVEYGFAVAFAAAGIALVLWAAVMRQPLVATPAPVLILAHRGSMNAARRTRIHALLVVLLFVEALRPDLARSIRALRQQIIAKGRLISSRDASVAPETPPTNTSGNEADHQAEKPPNDGTDTAQDAETDIRDRHNSDVWGTTGYPTDI
jgi:hypothetical protein